jgi:hypothetical protein
MFVIILIFVSASREGHQDHVEGARVAAAVHVALVHGSAEHSPIDVEPSERWWNVKAVVLAGDGVAHNDLIELIIQQEDATVAAPEQTETDPTAAVNLMLQVEALRRNAVWRA